MLKKTFIIISAKILIIFLILGGVVYKLFYSMDNLPMDTLYKSYQSPNKENKLDIYVNRASLSKDTFVGVVKFKNGKTRTLYFDNNVDELQFYAKWIDDETLEINKMKFNIHKDKYDFRREKD